MAKDGATKAKKTAVKPQVVPAMSNKAKKKAARADFRQRVKASRAERQAENKDALGLKEKADKQRDAKRSEEQDKVASKVKVKRSQLEKAVKALQQLVAKRSANANPLFSEASETIQAVFSLTRVPEKRECNPALIPLPHPLHDEKSEVCFISKDPQKQYKELLMQKHHVPGVTKVLGIDKLRRNFKTAEQKRALADAYDLFLCDQRVVEMMPSLMGTVFYNKKKKRPIPVKLTEDPTANIKKAMNGATLRVPMGSSFGVKFGRCSMGETELIENAAKVIAETVRYMYKNPVQSISIQATESPALPIWRRPTPPGERLDLKKYHSDSGSSAASQSGDASATASDTETGSFLASASGNESLSELETEGESVSMLETAGESLSELDSDAGDVDDTGGDMPLKKSLGKRKPGSSSPKTSPKASPKSPKTTPKVSPKLSPKVEAKKQAADMPPPKKKAKKA